MDAAHPDIGVPTTDEVALAQHVRAEPLVPKPRRRGANEMDGLVRALHGPSGGLEDLFAPVASYALQLRRVDPALLRAPPRTPAPTDLFRHESTVLDRKHARGLAGGARSAHVPVGALLVIPDHLCLVALLRVDDPPIAEPAAPAFGLAQLVIGAKPLGAQTLRHATDQVDGARRRLQLVGQPTGAPQREQR